MAEKDDVALPELGNNGQAAPGAPLLETATPREDTTKRAATDLEAVYDVPVTVQVILGKSAMEVSALLSSARAPWFNSTARSARPSIFT
jgi:flagellar motor switch protein FliN/FliY